MHQIFTQIHSTVSIRPSYTKSQPSNGVSSHFTVEVSTTGVTQKNLELPCLLILLIHTKHKTIRSNLGLTPRLYSLEGELIHWVDKAKSVCLTVRQFPIKAGWWDALLALQDFSRSNKHRNHVEDSLTQNPIDSIKYFLNFFGTNLKIFSIISSFLGTIFFFYFFFLPLILIFIGSKLNFFLH